ncbi:MAG: sigma-70 family RNA polymerase sigma factor [Anaerolineae bacterium]|nr:sigma-70 family RNA polymerase sigma factor [Anaerolineae bacterium]
MLDHLEAAVTYLTLDQLARRAIEQVRRCTLGLGAGDDAPHALEVVRRAARRDPAAFATLVGLCDPVIERVCPARLWARQDELEYEVVKRLEHRFLLGQPPYRVTTLPAFVRYVRLTIRTGVITLLRRRLQTVPLDTPWGWEPSTPAEAEPALDAEAARQTVRALLAALDNPLQREALLRRHGYGQSVASIRAALQTRQPDVTTQQVYRLLDLGKRGLRRAAGRDATLGRLAMA